MINLNLPKLLLIKNKLAIIFYLNSDVIYSIFHSTFGVFIHLSNGGSRESLCNLR